MSAGIQPAVGERTGEELKMEVGAAYLPDAIDKVRKSGAGT